MIYKLLLLFSFLIIINANQDVLTFCDNYCETLFKEINISEELSMPLCSIKNCTTYCQGTIPLHPMATFIKGICTEEGMCTCIF